jgi:hypothetical protein
MDAGGGQGGWYFSKAGGPPGQKSGPYTRDQLQTRAWSGAISAFDLVWGPGMPDWLPAAQVPGLLPAAPVTPVAPPAPGVARVAPYPPHAAQAQRRRSRPWLVPLVVTICIVVAGAAAGIALAVTSSGGGKTATAASTVGMGTTAAAVTTTEASAPATTTTEATQTTATTARVAPPIGRVEIKLPDSGKLVKTADYGEVPANEVIVLLADGKTRTDAESVAAALKGTIVGELEYLNGYQIETGSTTEAQLKSDLDTAKASPGVEVAFPNQQDALSWEIKGRRVSALTNEPTYLGDDGKGYRLIGVDKAWAYLAGSGISPSRVKVGIVDGGLYPSSGEFSGSVKVEYPDPNAGALTGQATGTATPGGHGTMVAGLIGADQKNGGMMGVASNLGENLTLSVLNKFSPPYGEVSESIPDENDPTKYVANGKTYTVGSLAALLAQVKAGATVINCSFGPDTSTAKNAEVARAYRNFFERMAKDYPEVVFVCAAGNEGQAITPSSYYPAGAGSGLSNVITVGNVDNVGGALGTSNTAGENGEITLGAPGEQAIQGVGPNGVIKTGGGTSAAAAQVSGAVALLLAIDPKLTAGDIKRILTLSASAGPAQTGGRLLNVAEAVRMAINQYLNTEYSAEQLEKLGVIDAVATYQEGTDPDTYTLKALLYGIPAEGLTLTMKTNDGVTLEDASDQSVTGPYSSKDLTAKEIDLKGVTVTKKLRGDNPQLTITRGDTGEATVLTFEKVDLNGKWTGTLTVSELTYKPGSEGGGSIQGCTTSMAESVIKALTGKPIPTTMDVTADETNNGKAKLKLDLSKVNLGSGLSGAKSAPQTYKFTYDKGKITFQVPADSGVSFEMTADVVWGDTGTLVMKGTMTGHGSGMSLAATFEVKQE